MRLSTSSALSTPGRYGGEERGQPFRWTEGDAGVIFMDRCGFGGARSQRHGAATGSTNRETREEDRPGNDPWRVHARITGF
jgi:hypothetical protein